MPNLRLESKDENILIFFYEGTPPKLNNGDILLSTKGEGFLRKVVAVRDLGGGRIEITTEPASLTDAFEELHIRQTIPLPNEINLSPQGIYLMPLIIEGPIFRLTFDVPVRTPLKFVGKFGLQPALDVEIDISGSTLKHFKLALNGEVRNELKFDLGIIRWEAPLIDYNGLIHRTPVILFVSPVGPVVFTGKIIMSGWVEIAGTCGYEVIGNLGYGVDLILTGGAEYNDGNWRPISNMDYTFNPTFVVETSTELQAELFLQPQVGIYIYDSAGPYLQLKPYGKGIARPTSTLTHLEVGLGLEGSIGGALRYFLGYLGK